MQLFRLLGLHEAVQGGRMGGCRYDLNRVLLPRMLSASGPLSGAATSGAGRVAGHRDLAGRLAGHWGRVRGQPKAGLSGSSGIRLQDGLVQRAGNFGRMAQGAVLASSSRARVVAASLLYWVRLLSLVGCVFTGLGLMGVAKVEDRRTTYEQGKATRAADRAEAEFRRVCLVNREAGTRVAPKAVLAAVRLPPRPLESPAGPWGGRGMLAAKAAGPDLRVAGRASVPALEAGRQPGRARAVQAAGTGINSILQPRG